MFVRLETLTILCLLIPVYVYFGYPVLLVVLNKVFAKHIQKDESLEPNVSFIISCYNEVSVIAEKIENTLALDYPAEKLNILVVSDGSEDGSDDVIKSYQDRGVKLIRQEGRLGKTMGLNLALEAIENDDEIVVFSDANAIYDELAIRKLVRNFADEKVGYVVGAALYTDSDSGASAANENAYWDYELKIKNMESNIHSVVGGDGAIYAIRRNLWEPLQQKDINDFVNPLQIVAKGYRGIFEYEARCYEETAGNFDKEIARKERIVNRSIRGLMRVKAVMNPFKVGLFSLEVISHKLLRWLIPLFLALGVLGSTILTIQQQKLFAVVVFGALLLLGLAFVGRLLRTNQQLPTIISTPYYFVMVNLYALRGIYKAVRGETQVTWNSARPSASGSNSGAGESIIGAKMKEKILFLAPILILLYALVVGLS